MRLEEVELWRVPLSLRNPIGTSGRTHRERPTIYLRLVTDEAEGWGEGAALAQGDGVDPSHRQVWRALVERVLPEALRRAGSGAELREDLVAMGVDSSGSKALKEAGAVLSMALLDVRLRRERVALGAWLGARESVEVGAMVGIPAHRDLPRFVDEVERLMEGGWRRLRVKIAPDWDRGPLSVLRSRFPDLGLLADANAAYGPEVGEAWRRLAFSDDLDLLCLEQPLGPRQLAGHVELGERLATPIGLDESLFSLDALSVALSAGACRVACLKPARLGGLLCAREALDRCERSGVQAFIGGFFETGLARAANAAVAGLSGASLPSDVGPPASYLDDPCGFPSPRRGLLELPATPGVGRAPSGAALRAAGGELHRFVAPDRSGPR